MYIENAKTIVIKIGSSNIVDNRGKLKKNGLIALLKISRNSQNRKEYCNCFIGSNSFGLSYLKISKKIKLEMSQAIASLVKYILQMFTERF